MGATAWYVDMQFAGSSLQAKYDGVHPGI